MKLTPFGEKVRLLRMRLGVSMKAMADDMKISSSYLSGIEYGEKRLLQKHIDSALAYFTNKIKQEEAEELLEAAEQSKDIVNTADLAPDAKGLVAAFARRLQEGRNPTPEIMNWIESKEENQ